MCIRDRWDAKFGTEMAVCAHARAHRAVWSTETCVAETKVAGVFDVWAVLADGVPLPPRTSPSLRRVAC
eukprot:2977302-Rhodomonas_salina.1